MQEDQVLQSIEKENVKFVRLQFTDIVGIVKNVTIPVGQVEKAFDEGIWFDGSSIEGRSARFPDLSAVPLLVK